MKGQLLEAQEHKDPHEIMIKSKILLLGINTHTLHSRHLLCLTARKHVVMSLIMMSVLLLLHEIPRLRLEKTKKLFYIKDQD